MERIYLVYITASNEEEAQKIAKTLVSERLAACANVYPRLYSFYWWEGKLEEDTESSIILKTRSGLLEKLKRRLKEIHSYSCPCLLALPVEEGEEDFCLWILKETGYKENK